MFVFDDFIYFTAMMHLLPMHFRATPSEEQVRFQ